MSHCSPLQEDTPASQEEKLLLTGQPSFSAQIRDTHTLLGSPPPFPGLPWDTDQCYPSPSPILAEFPNSLPLPRLRLCCPLMMLQTGCTLGTSYSKGIPPGKVFYGKAQLCNQALEQPSSGANSSRMQRGKGQRGERNIEPFLCAKPWAGHLAPLSSLK